MHNKTLKGLWDLVPLFARWDWPAWLAHLESLLFPLVGSHTRAPGIIETQSPYRSPECPPGWYRPIEIILIELTSVNICWLFIMNQSSCSCSTCSFHLVLTTVPWTRAILERESKVALRSLVCRKQGYCDAGDVLGTNPVSKNVSTTGQKRAGMVKEEGDGRHAK